MECLLGRPASTVTEEMTAEQAFAYEANTVVTALWSGIDDGLSEEQAEARLTRYGVNELVRDAVTPWWRLVCQQLRELVVALLLVAAVIAFALGEWIDGIAILLIVGLNAGLGLYQHWKAEHALGALRQLSAPLAKVIRAGVLRKLDARQLVPGDRIELEAGDHVPADARLLSSYSLQTLEAPLTGESTPIEKNALVTLPAETPLGDRRNMVFLGTVVAAGKASAIVTATGMQTELGRVADLLSHQKSPLTPLQMRMHQLGRWLVFICLALVAGIAALQVVRGETWLETLRLAVSLAVAAVPEGLPAALTITLALGAQRLAHRQALVRRLSSVETLGSVSVICSDKTGTLTRNEMTVREVATLDRHYRVHGSGYDPRGEIILASSGTEGGLRQEQPVSDNLIAQPTHVDSGADAVDIDLDELLTIGVWCNNAQVIPDPNGNDVWRVIGDPTEAALVVAARKAGIERDLQPYQFEFELPFDSDRKLMSVVVGTPAGPRRVFTKGAPENLLARCVAKQRSGQATPLTDSDCRRIRQLAAEMASRALRVIALAYRDLPQTNSSSAIEEELVLVGLVGMIDPPRAEARDAIQICRRAGIRPVMITGDHPETARAIGRELGLISADAAAVTGAELDQLSQQEFDRCVPRTAVFARATAEHKLRIVETLQRQGQVVAMTGDGVNDAPAVKTADIGIAMGITGTDVTKESAAMVLTNDNFATIVQAVEEGRAIYENIQRFVQYLLAGNVGKLLFMFIAVLAGWPTPLLAIQILWLNLVTDGLPALALGMEPTHDRLMSRPPRRADEPLIGRSRARRILAHGSLTAAAGLLGFFLVYRGDEAQLPAAQLVAFCILGLGQLAYSYVCRSDERTALGLGWSGNRPLLAATGASLILQLAVVLTPALHAAFGIVAYPSLGEWLLIMVLSLVPAVLLEGLKLVPHLPRQNANPTT